MTNRNALITDEVIRTGIEAWVKSANERLDPEHVMHAALTAALAALERTHVVVPKDKAAASIAYMVAEWYYGVGRKHIPADLIEKRLSRFAMLAAATEHSVLHKSDCAVHNEPASSNGPCDCGAISSGTAEHLDSAGATNGK